MYCQNCGAPNDLESVFCYKCGVKLDKSAFEQEVILEQKVDKPKNYKETRRSYTYEDEEHRATRQKVSINVPKKKISKLRFIIVVEIVALICLVSGFASAHSNNNNPENIAESYFVNIVNGNYDKAFKLLDVNETAFINADALQQHYCGTDFSQVSNYFIDENVYDTSLGETIFVHYRNKGDVEDTTFVVDLYKTDSNDWAIGYSSIVETDYQIIVQKGSKVLVDGIELTEEYKVAGDIESDDLYDVYIIPEIFSGMHSLIVSLGDISVVEEDFNTEYSENSYECTMMNLSEDVLTEIQNLAVNNMKIVYNAAVNGNAFEEIASIATTNESYLDDIRSDYEYLIDCFNEDDSTITDVRINNIEAWSESMSAYVTLSFDYEVDYQEKDWWTGELVDRTYKRTNTCNVSFIYENGEFVQTNLGFPALYY